MRRCLRLRSKAVCVDGRALFLGQIARARSAHHAGRPCFLWLPVLRQSRCCMEAGARVFWPEARGARWRTRAHPTACASMCVRSRPRARA
eukprot:6063193-Pleurochrysis_carterae.AAC.1